MGAEAFRLSTVSAEPKAAPLSAPGPIGRVVRLGLGVVLLYGTWNLARFGPDEIGQQLVNPVEWLIHMGIALWLLPAVVDIGWTRGVVRPIRPLALATVGVLTLVVRLIDGVWWGPIVGWPVLVATIYVFVHSGASFVLAAVLATPGCEMRALPHLSASLRGVRFTPHSCPGLMDDVDRWEAERVTRLRR